MARGQDARGDESVSMVTPRHTRPTLRRRYVESIDAVVYAQLLQVGQAVSPDVLSDNAYLALLLIAASGHELVTAYDKALVGWHILVRGEPDQECRFSPVGWQRMYELYLREAVESGAEPLADIWLDLCHELAVTNYPSHRLLLGEDQW